MAVVEIAGLVGLPDGMAQGFDRVRLTQLGPLAIDALDLILEPGDRLVRLVAPGRELDRPLRQAADQRRLVGAEPQRLGRVEVCGMTQLPEQPAGVVRVVGQHLIQVVGAVVPRLVHRTQPLREGLDLVGRVEQSPRRLDVRELGVQRLECSAALRDRMEGQLQPLLRGPAIVAKVVAEADDRAEGP